jgi:hypothetical protein
LPLAWPAACQYSRKASSQSAQAKRSGRWAVARWSSSPPGGRRLGGGQQGHSSRPGLRHPKPASSLFDPLELDLDFWPEYDLLLDLDLYLLLDWLPDLDLDVLLLDLDFDLLLDHLHNLDFLLALD